MAEPTSSTAGIATLITLVPSTAVLAAIGAALGLRGDVLFSGFCGAIAGIAFLDTVPSTGDTWREMLRTGWRALIVLMASAVLAGYLAPLLLHFNGMPDSLMNAAGFVIGLGAKEFASWFLARVKKDRPPPAQEGPTS